MLKQEADNMDRRKFLKFTGLAATTSLLYGPGETFAAPDKKIAGQMGMLIDISLCTGCRKCEKACSEINGMPEPDIQKGSAYKTVTTPEAFTVVSEFQTDLEGVSPPTNEPGKVFVKRQCMHCDQPACASACLVKAMYKTPEGPVTWRGSKCMGCRYCMLSCPFDMPKFEYSSNNPRVLKCVMCYEKRLLDGKVPACVEACPVEATEFGMKHKLLDVAKTRIYNDPKYVRYIYGEKEAGGTGVLYISKVPFQQLGFPMDIGTVSYPEFTKPFLYSVPVLLLLAPTLMAGIARARKKSESHD
jgi:Fe-S-cluster-containing dehydrogenase component